MNSELSLLAAKFNTAKYRMGYSGKNYLDVYDYYLKHMRNSNISLLELGILDGNSLRMWKTYFQNGVIYGVDINPHSMVSGEDRIFTYMCSQDSKEVLNTYFRNDSIDIIVDDASHVNELTLKSFDILFPKVKSGGYYIIEDLETSYLNLEEYNVRASWPGMNYNRPDVQYNNNREDMNNCFMSLVKQMDFGQGNVKSMHFHHQMCIIEKV